MEYTKQLTASIIVLALFCAAVAVVVVIVTILLQFCNVKVRSLDFGDNALNWPTCAHNKKRASFVIRIRVILLHSI